MSQASLFDKKTAQPLAEILRPKKFSDIVGQDHLLATDGPLQKMIDNQSINSMILWGPPGTGKTTIARLFSTIAGTEFCTISAIFTGVAELKKIFQEARDHAQFSGQKTILFVDEIHRFNRAQQDAFLPVVEDGTIILIGATTENPSFKLASALLSRCPVYTLNSLNEDSLSELLKRALLHTKLDKLLTDAAKTLLVNLSDGDGRFLLNTVEIIQRTNPQSVIDVNELKKILQKRAAHYDQSDDQHYNLISALHKSMRGSDPQAALYWFARMLNGGEDPLYIGRRLIRFASEDIGLADPQALPIALAGQETYERLGSPEGELALAEAVLYLSTAPKSNACYTAFKAAMHYANEHASYSPPKHILNAPTALMKDLGYGEDYQYDHDQKQEFSGQDYFPEKLPRQDFYQPKKKGFEIEIKERLRVWGELRNQKK